MRNRNKLYKQFENIDTVLKIIKGDYAFVLTIDIISHHKTNIKYLAWSLFSVKPLFYKDDKKGNLIFGSLLSCP